MSETTQEERDEARRFCTIPISFIRDADRLAAIERQVRELADWMDKQADSERVSSDGDEGHRAAEALESYAQELRVLIDAPDAGKGD